MGTRGWVFAGGLVLALVGGLGGAVAAQEPPGGVILRQGEPAPADGIFFTGPALERLVSALRDRESWQAQIETFRAQVQALEAALASSHEESQARQQALEAMKLAVAKAEWIDSNWTRIIERYEATITRLEGHNERLTGMVTKLETQRNLAMFANPIIGLLAFIAGIFFK